MLLKYYITSCTVLTKQEGRHPNAEYRPLPLFNKCINYER